MRKTYAYSRSNRGNSGVEFQQSQIEQFSASNGLQIDREFSDIGSGTQVGSNLQKLVEEIPSGSLLLMTERSRISRNSHEYQVIYNELSDKDVEVIFINEG